MLDDILSSPMLREKAPSIFENFQATVAGDRLDAPDAAVELVVDLAAGRGESTSAVPLLLVCDVSEGWCACER